MNIIGKIFITGIIFAVSYANSIASINGDMQKFSSMGAGSFINDNYRQINNISNHIYGMVFIQYPADIKFHEIFLQKPIDKYLISTSIGILNYGILEDANNKQFSANEQMIKLSAFNIESPSFTYGISAAYCFSQIDNYTSSLLTYSIGFNKSYLENRLIIGLSLENYSKVIKDYSNINDSLPSVKRISTSLKPRFLPLKIMMDYLYQDANHSEFIIGINGNIYQHFYFYSGKHLYLNDIDSYGVFNNIAFGIGILINSKYKVDLGMQYLTDGVLNIGTSFTTIILDNF